MIFLLAVSALASGSGELRVGYITIDEDGNQGANYPSYNLYEGAAVSLDNFSYRFTNGIRVGADLKNIGLENRNLNLMIDKPGAFGIKFHGDKYRRVYNFDGSNNTKRDRNGADLWAYLDKHVKIFGGFSNSDFSGKIGNLFNIGFIDIPREYDYRQFNYNAGIRLNCKTRMLQTELNHLNYFDHKNISNNQKRTNYKVNGYVGLFKENRVILSGGFRHFQTVYSETLFKVKSNVLWGGGRLQLPENFALSYNLLFDRSGSDSDRVKSDNLAQAVYLSYIRASFMELTAGFQSDINDDAEFEVESNSFYLRGKVKPTSSFEWTAEYGMRTEDVKTGIRLTGDEERTRYRLGIKYSPQMLGNLILKYEGRIRKNDDISSKADFQRIGADWTFRFVGLADIGIGYSNSFGKYENLEQNFEFTDHVLSGDVTLKEIYRLRLGLGGAYYRSKRDLDIESFNLKISGVYQIVQDARLEVIYNVQNFDDFLTLDNYYTSNIVEVNIIKGFSF